MAETRGATGAVRITSTGFAFVHEGELVFPKAGSEAQAAQVMDDARASIHYYFPVEIEIVAGGRPIDPHQVADLALERLARSVRSTKT
jgi:hypothetical protein